MNVGDVVAIIHRNHWGGIVDQPRKYGVLMKRTYMAYSKGDSLWEVMTSGKIQIVIEKSLRKIV